MWKCDRCREDNADTAQYCVKCGSRRAEQGSTAGTAQSGTGGTYYTGQYQQPGQRPYTPHSPGCYERICPEAKQLESWGQALLVIGIVVGALLFLGTMITSCSAASEYSYYSYSVGTMIGGFIGALINGALCVLGGLVARLLLRGFAVIVESHYRNLKSDKK